MKKTNKNEFGCLMTVIKNDQAKSIVKFGRSLISDDILYEDPEEEYGRDDEPHITSLYGFSKDLTNREVIGIIGESKQQSVTVNGLSMFQGEEYDVVKFDIDPSPWLIELNRKCKEYPYINKFPEYHPHMTLAYVKKGSFPHTKTNFNIDFIIDRFKYSGMDGRKHYYNLK